MCNACFSIHTYVLEMMEDPMLCDWWFHSALAVTSVVPRVQMVHWQRILVDGNLETEDMGMRAVIEKEERDQTPIREALQVKVNSPLGLIRQKALFADTLLGTNGGQRGQRTWATSSPSYYSASWFRPHFGAAVVHGRAA